jgi:uncharacterized protein (TIGR00369 family)
MKPAAIDKLPFADHMNLQFVEVEDGRAVVECPTRPEHANSRGVLHGGVVSSLIDTAAGAAVAYQPSVGGGQVATVALTVNFIRAGQVGDRLRATGRRRGGKQIITCDVEVIDQHGETVAFGVATLKVL